MAELISEIWSGLRDAGLPEVMLYLPDHSASRCHWDDTVEIAGIRVALIADQERKIVRLIAVNTCTGIGVASPKGIDPSGYKATVQNKLSGQSPTSEEAPADEPAATAPVAVSPPTPPPPPAPEVSEQPARPENPAARWGGSTGFHSRNAARFVNGQPQGTSR